MNEYGAKRVSIEVNGKEIWGWSNDEWYLPKDNSKENQDRLLEDFKYKQRYPNYLFWIWQMEING